MPAVVTAAAAWIGNAIAGAATALGATAATAATIATVTTAVSQIALYAGLQYAIDDISRQKAAPQGQELQLRMDADLPREMIIGERVVAGSMVARYSRGSNLYNAHFVYQLADHPCVELSKVYGDGRVVRSTPLTHGTRTEITAYSYSGGGRVWMTWHDGRPGQTVDSDLVTKSAQDPDVVAGAIQGWTNNHLGRGCAYVHIEVQWDSDILTSIPQFLFHVKGAKLYDRRLDTTAGGSGSHRIDDPSTWAYSTNAAVALDHYLLGYEVEGDPLAFGIGLSKAEVPYDIFAAAADLADEDVTTGTGPDEEVIKRYAANGIVSAGDFFEDVIEAFQNQMAARIVDLGGRIGILGAEERTSVVSLDDDDWASDEAVRYADKLPFSDLYGAVIGSFPDPANLYQPTAYEKQVTDYLLLPDGGEATTAQLDLPFEVHPRRAVRLASAWLARESLQPRLIGTFATRSLAWKLEPGDWFSMTSARLQITGELFEVIDIVKHDDFTVTLTARAIDPDFLAFSVDDDPDLSVPPAIDPYDLILDTPTFDAVVTSLDNGAGYFEPAIEFTLTSDENVARSIEVEYGVWDGVDVLGPTQSDIFPVDQIVTNLRKGVLPLTDYKVRARSKAGIRQSLWTAWSSVITTGEITAGGDVTQGFGHNALVDSEFRYGGSHWRTTAQSGGVSAAVNTTNGLRRYTLTGSGVTVGHYLALDSFPQLTSFPVLPGEAVEASAYVGGSNLSKTQIFIDWRDASGANISFSTIVEDVSPTAGSGEITTFERIGVIGVAPANTVRAFINVRGIASTSAPVLQVCKAMLAKAHADQEDLTPWNPGFDGEPGANVTETRTAAAILGQGSFATLSSINSALADANNLLRRTAGGLFTGELAADVTLTHTAAAITGQGGLATLGFVTIGTNLRRADGTTVATESLVVTSLGTAAAITGQGSFATLSSIDASLANANNLLRFTSGGLFTGELNADLTSSHTAAAISGQGGLATVNFVTIGTNVRRADGTTVATESLIVTALGTAAAISGQGGLATLSFVHFSSTVRLADGSTVVTDAMVVTASGTAAAISGQGALATKNQAAAGDINVSSLSSMTATIGLLRTATTGARLEIEDNQIRVYDSSSVLRVRFGIW